MPAALQGVDWEAAKTALAMGARMEDVAKDLGIGFRTLQKRAQRGKWLVATTAIAKAQRSLTKGELAQSVQNVIPGISGLVSKRGSLTPDHAQKQAEIEAKGAVLALQTLERNDEKTSVLASTMALKAVENASKRKKALPINTLQDLDKAVMITKRAAGKDREESKVTVALFGGGAASAGSAMPEAARQFRVRVQDVETVTIAQEGT